jgi:NAD(P)-dependent dehydrogenase (short-subunit alcohol dehydrogenase family)
MAVSQSLAGKTILITGATGGIGRAAARALAGTGAQLVLVGRNQAKAEATVSEIRLATGNDQLSYVLGDLSVLAEVRRVAGEVLERHDRVDVLVNNAGGIFARRQVTADGFEHTFALNHLGYFVLTDLLLERLRASAPARIVNVSSDAHRSARLAMLDDLQSERGYGPMGFGAYGRSKLMNVLFTYELARRLEGTGVTANAMHPGFVASGFGLNNRGLVAALIRLTQLFARTPEQGADTAVYLASSPDVEGMTGQYFADRKAVASSAVSYDVAAQQRLWEISARLVGLSAPPQ